MADKQSNGVTKKYFILLEDTTGIDKKIKFGGFRGRNKETYQALKGEIFERSDKSNDNDTEFIFVSTENPDRSIVCVEENLKCLKWKEYNFLIAVASKNERIRLLESKILKEIMDIEKGDMVTVDLEDGVRTTGKVRYIGPCTGKKIGYYFGILFEVS